jgi:hypothetical protein
MPNWLERARDNLKETYSQPTAKTAETPVLSVLAVSKQGATATLRKSPQGIVSFGSSPPACFSQIDPAEFSERAAIIEANGVPREWAEGLAVLDTMQRPVGYSPSRWAQVVNDAAMFLDRWGRQAAALGWRALDVFGVNPDAPETRYDCAGLVPLLQGRSIIAITADTARIDCGSGAFMTFYRETMAAGAVALWNMEG